MRCFYHNETPYNEYAKPSPEELNIKMYEFERSIETSIKRYNLNPDDINYNYAAMTEILIRVDQRRLHYRMYHKQTEMNELKETAALCYWVLKYKPITLRFKANGASKAQFGTYKVNEYYCIHMILRALDTCWEKEGKTGRTLSDAIMKSLMYDLCHRSFSYDSLGTLIDGLARVY